MPNTHRVSGPVSGGGRREGVDRGLPPFVLKSRGLDTLTTLTDEGGEDSDRRT